MKQNFWGGLAPILVLVLLMCLPINSSAKKIKYSEQIIYNGKVDANGLPKGEGKLITKYGEYTDILEGIFDNTTVTSATLKLKIFEKKYRFFEYSGTVEYTIAENSSSVTYKLTDGGFSASIVSEKDFNYKNEYPEIKIEESFVVTKDTPLTITNNLQERYKNFIVDNVTKSYELSNKQQELSSLWKILNLEIRKLIDDNSLGNATQFKRLVSFRVDSSNFKFYPQPDAVKELLYDSGAKVIVSSTNVSCKYANGDYCNIDMLKETVGFRKTLTDGVLNKDASSKLITYEGKDKKAATSMYGIKDLAAFMECKTMDDAKNIHIFYFDPLRETFIKSLNGDAAAMLQLGKAMYEGDGIDKDVKRGKAWLEDAIKNGSEEAKTTLDKIKKQEAEELIAQNEAKLQRIKQDGEWTLGIAACYAEGGEHSFTIDSNEQSIYFEQNLDSALVWYKYYYKDKQPDGFDIYTKSYDLTKLLNNVKLIDKYHDKYVKKYGKEKGEALFRGNFSGLSLAAVQEYLKDLSSLYDWAFIKKYTYSIRAQETSVNDVIRYGRGVVKAYSVFKKDWHEDTYRANYIRVINGKVISSTYSNNTDMSLEKRMCNQQIEIKREEGARSFEELSESVRKKMGLK